MCRRAFFEDAERLFKLRVRGGLVEREVQRQAGFVVIHARAPVFEPFFGFGRGAAAEQHVFTYGAVGRLAGTGQVDDRGGLAELLSEEVDKPLFKHGRWLVGEVFVEQFLAVAEADRVANR